MEVKKRVEGAYSSGESTVRKYIGIALDVWEGGIKVGEDGGLGIRWKFASWWKRVRKS